MTMEMFTVFDQAAERYMDPFAAPTVGFAIRGFQEACGQDGHQFQKFPEDYILYHIGTFNAELGEIEPMAGRKIAMATSYTHGGQLDIVSETEAEA